MTYFLVLEGFLTVFQILENKLEGYNKKEKKKMVLPEETTSGLHITGMCSTQATYQLHVLYIINN